MKALAAALACGLACASALGCEQADAAAGEGGGPPDGPKGPTPVQVVGAETGDVTSSWRFLGQVQPSLEAVLASAVAGHVLEVRAREGDAVKHNDALVVLDSRKARASLAAARAKVSGTEAELAQAQRQVERVKKLGSPTISEPEREGFLLAAASLAARLEGERAEVQRLQVEVSQHTLKAPFDGTLRAREVDPGAWVESGTPVLELVSLEQLELHVDVSAEIGSQLTVGDAATIIGPGELPARIEGIVPALDTTTRTMRVRLSPQVEGERPAWLLAGRALEVAFDVTLEGEGVLVPRDAVMRGALETRVMVVREGKSAAVPVEVLAHAGERALVRGEGLEAGSQVIVRGNERLSPGQAVEVTE